MLSRLFGLVVAGLALVAVPVVFAASELVDATPTEVEGATTVDSAAAKKLFDEGALFVDLRKDVAWDAGRIPGAVHLDFKKKFSQEALESEAGKDEAVVFYCSGTRCPRSAKACTKALSWGYTKVYYYRDGYPGWKQAGLPVE
jgi:rhodanese-related sulfurtransferase